MSITFRVQVEGEDHVIRVDTAETSGLGDLHRLRDFAVTTAFLEHYGYLPRGVVNAEA